MNRFEISGLIRRTSMLNLTTIQLMMIRDQYMIEHSQLQQIIGIWG